MLTRLLPLRRLPHQPKHLLPTRLPPGLSPRLTPPPPPRPRLLPRPRPLSRRPPRRPRPPRPRTRSRPLEVVTMVAPPTLATGAATTAVETTVEVNSRRPRTPEATEATTPRPRLLPAVATTTTVETPAASHPRAASRSLRATEAALSLPTLLTTTAAPAPAAVTTLAVRVLRRAPAARRLSHPSSESLPLHFQRQLTAPGSRRARTPRAPQSTSPRPLSRLAFRVTLRLAATRTTVAAQTSAPLLVVSSVVCAVWLCSSVSSSSSCASASARTAMTLTT